LDHERALYWISKGAQPSDRVHKLIKTYEQSAKEAGETTKQ
jgi:ribosomal protein S16